MLVFHGYTVAAKMIREHTRFSALSEEHGFVVAYPQGTKDSSGKTFFNVGYAFHEIGSVDDVMKLWIAGLELEKAETVDLPPSSTEGIWPHPDTTLVHRGR